MEKNLVDIYRDEHRQIKPQDVDQVIDIKVKEAVDSLRAEMQKKIDALEQQIKSLNGRMAFSGNI